MDTKMNVVLENFRRLSEFAKIWYLIVDICLETEFLIWIF